MIRGKVRRRDTVDVLLPSSVVSLFERVFVLIPFAFTLDFGGLKSGFNV